MSYLFFHWVDDKTSDNLLQTISTAFLIPQSSLVLDDCREGVYSTRKLSSLPVAQLIGIVSYLYFGKGTVFIKLPHELTTDKNYVNAFGDRYFGCMSSKIKKAQLYDLATAYKQLDKLSELPNYFLPNDKALEERLTNAGLTKVKAYDLIDIAKRSIRPVVDEINKLIAIENTKVSSASTIFLRNFAS